MNFRRRTLSYYFAVAFFCRREFPWQDRAHDWKTTRRTRLGCVTETRPMFFHSASSRSNCGATSASSASWVKDGPQLFFLSQLHWLLHYDPQWDNMEGGPAELVADDWFVFGTQGRLSIVDYIVNDVKPSLTSARRFDDTGACYYLLDIIYIEVCQITYCLR